MRQVGGSKRKVRHASLARWLRCPGVTTGCCGIRSQRMAMDCHRFCKHCTAGLVIHDDLSGYTYPSMEIPGCAQSVYGSTSNLRKHLKTHGRCKKQETKKSNKAMIAMRNITKLRRKSGFNLRFCELCGQRLRYFRCGRSNMNE